MFTSISNLRKSNLEVTSLKKITTKLNSIYHGWDDDWYFPIAAIGLSNTVEDIRWAQRSHVKLVCDGTPVFVADRQVSASAIYKAAVDGSQAAMELRLSNKRVWVQHELDAINEALSQLLAIPHYCWDTHPISTDRSKAVVLARKFEPTVSSPKKEVPADRVFDTRFLAILFERLFCNEIVDFAITYSSRNTEGIFSNDRTQGKFMAFVRTLELVHNGTIDVNTLHRDTRGK